MTQPAGQDEVTVLVADDEALARRRLLELLGRRPGVRVVGECSNGRETLAAVRELRPDILFLDVQMPGLDGFEVLARIEPEERPVLIFSTAYDEYALSAFDVHAVDYLLKPYSDDRWEEAFELAETRLRTRLTGELRDRLQALLAAVGRGRIGTGSGSEDRPACYRDRFAVPGRKGIVLVDADSVDWIEADGDYVHLHEGQTRHLLRATMTELERGLDPARFVRIHRSVIVQTDRVRELRSDAHGDYTAVLAGGPCLRVGRTYREAVLRRLGVRG